MNNDPIDYIIEHLRKRDREEIEECGHTPEQARAAFHSPNVHTTLYSNGGGEPAAIISFREITPKALAVALLATEKWPQVAKLAYRDGIKNIRPFLLRRGYVRAECRTMEGHDEAVRFLEHLGFKLEVRIARFGKTGRAFLQYAWVADDHAHNGPT